MITENIFDKTEKYLKQTEEIYGGSIFMEKTEDKENIDSESITIENSKEPTTNIKQRIKILKGDDELFTDAPPWMQAKTLDELYECIKDCQNCPLGSTRQNFVFGTGNPDADIMIIGEAPGADEDKQGLPFVGGAGNC